MCDTSAYASVIGPIGEKEKKMLINTIYRNTCESRVRSAPCVIRAGHVSRLQDPGTKSSCYTVKALKVACGLRS